MWRPEARLEARAFLHKMGALVCNVTRPLAALCKRFCAGRRDSAAHKERGSPSSLHDRAGMGQTKVHSLQADLVDPAQVRIDRYERSRSAGRDQHHRPPTSDATFAQKRCTYVVEHCPGARGEPHLV